MEEKNPRVKELEERLSAIIAGEFSDWNIDEVAQILDELKRLLPEDPTKTEQAWQEFLELKKLREQDEEDHCKRN
jgi:hypothetical protein